MNEQTLFGVVTEKDPISSAHERDYQDIFKKQSAFLELSYDELEEMNLEVKKDRVSGVSRGEFEKKFLDYLGQTKGIKAVVVCFTDMEGRFQMLDYDKKFLLEAHDNLTFDGSSIKGFSDQNESDLRLKLDWSTFRWIPADIFGSGKVLLFANVCDQEGEIYKGDFRANLAKLSADLRKEKGIVINTAPEVEGILLKGKYAEQDFDIKKGFELATQSGYFNCLPQDRLKIFIDKMAEVQRSLGFMNEKDHPEVAPAQFELSFKYSTALEAADQIQLYKMVARQIARFMGMTATFLPKPLAEVNGSGMHTNISLEKDGKNLFYDVNGEYRLSEMADKFLTGILYYAKDLCLAMNSSVNSYRRLDPKYEAPNEIKVSNIDRGSMVRIPIGNEKSARVEVRTVAPDANPYLCIYSIAKAGLAGVEADEGGFAEMKKTVSTGGVKKLPSNIYVALDLFSKSKFMKEIMGEGNHEKYLNLKRMAADRSPRDLGRKVKTHEILYHHDVTNQMIWSDY
jgi:glutamine synthetase